MLCHGVSCQPIDPVLYRCIDAANDAPMSCCCCANFWKRRTEAEIPMQIRRDVATDPIMIRFFHLEGPLSFRAVVSVIGGRKLFDENRSQTKRAPGINFRMLAVFRNTPRYLARGRFSTSAANCCEERVGRGGGGTVRQNCAECDFRTVDSLHRVIVRHALSALKVSALQTRPWRANRSGFQHSSSNPCSPMRDVLRVPLPQMHPHPP